MKLSELVENPDNPSAATDEEIKRLKGKLERVPKGLTAMRIAYVTDKIEGKKMVISGNKRLRVLKEQFGEDAELPDEYFQDVTSMSEAERHEFIVTANISDGHWDAKKLLEQYDTSELDALMSADSLQDLLDMAEAQGQQQHNQDKDSFKDRYIAAPFSVLISYKGKWKDRKEQWKNALPYAAESREGVLEKNGEENLFTQSCGSVSIFDPALAEVLAHWFCIPNGSIFDTFAGDTMKGLVFAKCGHKFRGIELRKEQVESNNKAIAQFKQQFPGEYDIEYICDDGQNADKHFEDSSFDLFFSCPPYYDLEVYSDDVRDASNQGTYEEFLSILDTSFGKATKVLKDDSFAVVVVGDIRDKNGFQRDFQGDVKRIFRQYGMPLYNELVYATPFGNAAMQANLLMNTRKIVKVHQNVLVFFKGNPKNISKKFPQITYANKEIEEFLGESK